MFGTNSKILLLGAFLSMGVGLPACGTPTAKAPQLSPQAMPEGETWAGVYYHPVFGNLHLVEQDTHIVGKWKRTDQSHWGELDGTKSGNVIRFSWKEHKYGSIGPSSTADGKGYFVYKVGASKIPEITGEYGLKNDEAGSSWNCVKQLNVKPDLDSIKGEIGGTEIPTTQDSWQ